MKILTVILLLVITCSVQAQETADEPITAENAASVQENARLGAGRMGEALDWSANGLYAASALGVLQFDLANLAAAPRLIETERKPVSTLETSAGLVTAQLGNTVTLLDATTGETVAVLEDPYQVSVYQVTISPDGTRAATASIDGKVRLWDARTGERLAVLDARPVMGFSGIPESTLIFSADSTLLAQAVGTEVFIWNAADGAVRGQLTIPGGAASIAFSPDAARLAVGGSDGSVSLWDITSTSATRQSMLTGHQFQVKKLAFSPDGTTLLTTSDDNTTRLWNVAEQRENWQINNIGQSVDLSFSPDGSQFAVMWRGGFGIYNTADGALVSQVNSIADEVMEIAFSADGTRLATVGFMNGVTVWDVMTREVLTKLDHSFGGPNGIMFSPDGSQLVGLTFGGEPPVLGIQFWDAITGAKTAFWPYPPAGTRDGDGMSGMTHGVLYSPDGKLLITGRGDGTIYVFDAATGEMLTALKAHNGEIVDLAFTSDGTRLVTTALYPESSIKVWDMADPRAPREIAMIPSRENTGFASVALSPDGQTLLARFLDEAAPRIYDLTTGTEQTQDAQPQPIPHQFDDALLYSPDGSVLVSGLADIASPSFTLNLQDAATGEVLAAFHYDALVRDVAFTPDGTLLAVALTDGTVRLLGVN